MHRSVAKAKFNHRGTQSDFTATVPENPTVPEFGNADDTSGRFTRLSGCDPVVVTIETSLIVSDAENAIQPRSSRDGNLATASGPGESK